MEIEKFLNQEDVEKIISELKNPEEVELFLKSLEELVSEGSSRNG